MADMKTTITYSVVDGLEIKLDVHAPEVSGRKEPGLVFFHGGRLVCGARDDMFLPGWLKGLLSASFSNDTSFSVQLSE